MRNPYTDAEIDAANELAVHCKRNLAALGLPGNNCYIAYRAALVAGAGAEMAFEAARSQALTDAEPGPERDLLRALPNAMKGGL